MQLDKFSNYTDKTFVIPSENSFIANLNSVVLAPFRIEKNAPF